MTATAAELMAFSILPATQMVTAKDAILYAVSVGYASDADDPNYLAALYERCLEPVPTFANVVALNGPGMRRLNVDWSRMLHAEQRLFIHREIKVGVTLESRTRTLSIADRGPGKGMYLTVERNIWQLSQSGCTPVATILHTSACLGDGGCGSAGVPPPPLQPVPDRAPDKAHEVRIPLSAAALYRLNGDLNPLHIDPEAAAAGGFSRPILHGLCTFGYAGYAIGRLTPIMQPSMLGSIAARFTAPFWPGETLRTEVWETASQVRFRCRAVERDVVVLDRGIATVR